MFLPSFHSGPPAAAQDDRKHSADLFGRPAALPGRQRSPSPRPLTRPAPAGESAGSEPSSPARGEGWGLHETASNLSARRGLRTSRNSERVDSRRPPVGVTPHPQDGLTWGEEEQVLPNR